MADAKTRITDRAKTLGFDAIGFTRAELSRAQQQGLKDHLAANHHATMSWMATRAAERADPKTLWPAALTIISLGLSYAPATDALAGLAQKSAGNISVYARNRDYHDVVKGKLKHLAQFIASLGADVKVFVDTAPVMEKPLAQSAGLGWQGKHTNLVSRRHGSWLFLGEVFTTLEIPTDTPETDHCGTCTACQTACPTDAFPAPYQLDANRCISYLTIEHAGPIPEKFRPAIGNRIYGCDDCLAVCPWNKFATTAAEQKFAHRPDLIEPPLAELALLTETAFGEKFSASPIKRIGRNRFIRNVAIAIGNSANPALLPTAQSLTTDPDPAIAESAQWALTALTTRHCER
jgi:epoxyqueuosine reductase